MVLTNAVGFFPNLGAHRSLLKNLVIRDLKRRYVGSAGGFLWSFIHPLVLLVSYTFIFGIVFKQRLGPEDGTESFPIYLFCGILPWLTFSDSLLRSCTVISDNATLVTKTAIPSELLPMSVTLSSLFHHLIGLGILLIVLVASGAVHPTTLWILLYLPFLLVLTQGFAWLVSSLNVFFRDTVQILQVLMIFWFWFTPILYSVERIPPGFASVIALNPMSTVVVGYRSALLGTAAPSVTQLLTLSVWTGLVFFAGAILFNQTKSAFADVL